MSYPAYPEYKDSGVEWLGKVPVNWTVSRLGFEAWVRARLGWKGLKAEEYVDNGYVFLSTPNIKGRNIDFDQVNYITKQRFDESPEISLRIGDVLLAKDGSTLGTVNIVRSLPRPTTVNSSIAVITPNNRLNGLFLRYLFDSKLMRSKIESIKGGMGVPHLFQADLVKFYLPLPPLAEQSIIATFLDHETARIDALVEEQQRLIALLKEKRQAVISHAVTKGLDPDVPMKDSGVEWLGEVPEHWEVGSLKYALEVVADVDHYMPTSVDSGVPYVMTGDLSRLVSEIDLDSCKKVTREDYQKLSRKIKTLKGDVIMARYATIGSVSYVDIDEEFIVSYSCVTIRPRAELTTGIYLFYYFQSDAFIQGISNMINANTQENVGVGDLKEVKVTLPNIQVQKAIADELEVRLTNLDRITKSSKTTIHLLKERRSALISAAVTGKIDVRGWQPPKSSATQEASQQEAV